MVSLACTTPRNRSRIRNPVISRRFLPGGRGVAVAIANGSMPGVSWEVMGCSIGSEAGASPVHGTGPGDTPDAFPTARNRDNLHD